MRLLLKYGMNGSFEQDIETFLEGNGIEFNRLSNACLFIVRTGLLIVPVALEYACNMDERRREALVSACLTELLQYRINDIFFLYEDAFRRGGMQWRKRVLARCGVFKSVFARKCSVVRLQSQKEKELARAFLKENHSLGWCSCKYCYALVLSEKGMRNCELVSFENYKYDGEEVVAVASFSSALSVKRYYGRDLFANGETGNGHSDYAMGASAADAENSGSAHLRNVDEVLPFESYQWLRYASLSGTRVLGGMGRLLKAFISDLRSGTYMNNNGTLAIGKAMKTDISDSQMQKCAVQNIEIMSYSDNEWSCGNVYRQLGFKEYGGIQTVGFWVDMKSWRRLRKQVSGNGCKDSSVGMDTLMIKNCGSKRFLLQYISQ